MRFPAFPFQIDVSGITVPQIMKSCFFPPPGGYPADITFFQDGFPHTGSRRNALPPQSAPE